MTFFDIALPFAEPLHPITLPRLCHLVLRTRHSTQRAGPHVPLDQGDDSALLWFTHVDMPSLSHFEYYGETIYPPTMLNSALIPWPAITTLHASRSRRADRTPLPPTPVLLPVLQDAHFRMDCPDILDIVAAIQAPALRHIHIQGSPIFIGNKHPAAGQVTHSIQSISSAHISLTRLTVIDINLAYTALHSLLASLDVLEHLTLRYRPSMPSANDFYYPDATNTLRDWASSSLSPNLHHLSIMSNTWNHSPAGTLLQIARTRCQTDEARRLVYRCAITNSSSKCSALSSDPYAGLWKTLFTFEHQTLEQW
ncbi:hypothetical protein EV122DRAFT_284798 [Schizophyllum commune]